MFVVQMEHSDCIQTISTNLEVFTGWRELSYICKPAGIRSAITVDYVRGMLSELKTPDLEQNALLGGF